MSDVKKILVDIHTHHPRADVISPEMAGTHPWDAERGCALPDFAHCDIIGETGLKDFARIRIGIRDEAVDIPIINYVLAEVRKEDYELFAEACHKAGAAAAEFARGLDIEKVMCKFN
jgi:hypothetical protein